jgi:hypothetical protein
MAACRVRGSRSPSAVAPGDQVRGALIQGSLTRRAAGLTAALLIAAGRDGAWHQGWADAAAALQGRQTTDQLASVFYRYQHLHDQELPLEP